MSSSCLPPKRTLWLKETYFKDYNQSIKSWIVLEVLIITGTVSAIRCVLEFNSNWVFTQNPDLQSIVINSKVNMHKK